MIQYAIAVDRVNERIAHLYEPSASGRSAFDQDGGRCRARQHKIWVGVCGEMAGDIELTPAFARAGSGRIERQPGVGAAGEIGYSQVSREECREISGGSAFARYAGGNSGALLELAANATANCWAEPAFIIRSAVKAYPLKSPERFRNADPSTYARD